MYKALYGDVTEVAVKRLNSAAVQEADLQAFREEAWIFAQCRNPHICQFLGICQTPVRFVCLLLSSLVVPSF